MRRLKSKNVHKIISLLMIAVIIIAVALGGFVGPAAVYAVTYSDVLTDLQIDENFNTADYPADSDDYSLSVIQIAESTDGELLVYVYQPSYADMPLTATQISMSLYEWNTSDTSYSLYDLTLVSEKGVFQKYRVDNFTVSNDSTRYYDISEIFREFNADIDEEQDNGNTIDEISFEVSECWRADTDSSGNVTYTMEKSNTVMVTSKRVGYIEYPSGFSLYGEWCDSHFVAFSCDYDIDYLYEADVYYVSRSYSYSVGLGLSGEKTYGDEEDCYVYIDSEDDTVSYTGSGWLAKTYSWERIEKVSDFISDSSYTLTDDATENIEDMQWVLRFAETSVYSTAGLGSTTVFGTDISSVTILRLKFLSSGTVWNLGVVDNKTSGSDEPDGYGNTSSKGCGDYTSLIKQLLMIAALVLILVLCAPILPYVAQAIIWIISLPFKLISAIVQAIKKSSDKPKKE